MFDAASLLTPARDGLAEVPPWDHTPDVAGTVASIRCAGDLFAGEGLLNQMHIRSVSTDHQSVGIRASAVLSGGSFSLMVLSAG